MLSEEKYPTFVEITGKEKRYKPTKHNVFIVHVQWSDNSRVPIYRQYSDFSQLHTQLQEFTINLPETECNVKLPSFPNKKEFWRPDSNKNDEDKNTGCNEYFRKVLSYEILAKSQAIVDFFMPKPDDIKPASATSDNQGRRRSKTFSLFGKKEEPMKPNLQTNGKLRTIKGSPSPNNRRKTKEEDEPVYVSRPRILESYLVTADYQSIEEGHVTMKEGHFVQVIEKNTNGWWLLSTEYGDGWGPASHLQSLSGLDQDEEEIYSGSKYITTNSYAASHESQDEISFPKGAMIDVLHKRNDGWWVIKYQSKVGYAPAMYMTAYKNPHYYQRRPSPSPTSDTSEAAKSDDKQKEKCIQSDQDTRSESVKSAAKSEENLNETQDSRSQQEPVDQEVTQQREKAEALVSKRTRSSDSFGDELECVTSWIDQSALKRIQEENLKKRDYANIPQTAVSHTNDKSTPSDTLKSCSPKPENKVVDVAKHIMAGAQIDDLTTEKDNQQEDNNLTSDKDSSESLDDAHKPITETDELAVDDHDLELDYINIPKIGVARKVDSVEEPGRSTIPIESPHKPKFTDSNQASNNANIVSKSETVSSAQEKQHSLSTIDVESVQSNECAEFHSKEVVGRNTIKTSDTTDTILNRQSNTLHEDAIDTRMNQRKSAKQSNVMTNQSATATVSLGHTKWSYGDSPQSNSTVISHSPNSEVTQLQMAVLHKQLEKLDRENINLDAETEILNMKKTKLSLEIEMVKLKLERLKEGNSINLNKACQESYDA